MLLSFSGWASGFLALGRLTGTPYCSRGVTTMKMIRSTRHTSAKGVMLMSAFRLFLSPTFMLMATSRKTYFSSMPVTFTKWSRSSEAELLISMEMRSALSVK